MRSPTDRPPKDRIWTLGRIAALVLIAVSIAGLAHVRFSHRAGWAAVPAGAHAGQLTLKSCTYPTEKGDVAADCGTLVVPENRADPKSRLIAMPVTRIHARSAHPSEPIFRLQGGPGQTNMEFPFASRYIEHHDLVLVGYRGVDGSARLDCPEVTDARRHTTDLLSKASISASARALRSCADRLTSDGYDLAGYTLSERVDDFDAARRAMGYGRVDLLSESFGTRLALVYAWRHPQRVHRSVMMGVNPPGHFLWQPEQTDAQLRRFSALCGHGARCGGSSGDLVASMGHTASDLPGHWGPLPIHRGNVLATSFFGLMDASTDAAPISAPMTIDAWRAAAEGDASGLWFESLAGALIFPRAEVWGDAAAMAGVDAAAAAEHFGPGPHASSVLDDAGTRFLWAGGELARAWPRSPGTTEYSHVRDTDVPTLMISGELDGATPAVNATRDLLPHLAHGHQVVLRGIGHTTDFWHSQVPAGNHLINGFMDTGRVDASRYVTQKVDFTPEQTQTTLAKELAGAMVALALFTLGSLLWMARRVRRRGHLGRVTRVVARSVWALVIGFGGWLAGAMTALIVLPGVPVDAELLLLVAMGAPVALAAYWAWSGPDRAATKMAGLAAAVGGALAGGFVGFSCVTGMMALLTTLVGAVAGTNLALIGLDVVSETRRRRRAAEPRVTERPLEPHVGEPVGAA